MTVEIRADHAGACERACQIVAAALSDRPTLVLGLPTGRTSVGLYQALAAAGLDWSGARTFNVDEFAGLPAGHPGTFRGFMDAHLFTRVNLAAAHIGFLRGDTDDAGAECARYDRAIGDAGGIDLLVLGLGANGHIGFNEPGPALRAETHAVALHASTRAANAGAFGGDAARVPARALTMGMAQVLRARRVLMIATGSSKRDAVAAMANGPLTTTCPASWLQVHAEVTLVLDRAAAASLQ
jgi:glucosamine-6-phosphate deaminase